jgi:hypothetical protein
MWCVSRYLYSVLENVGAADPGRNSGFHEVNHLALGTSYCRPCRQPLPPIALAPPRIELGETLQ